MSDDEESARIFTYRAGEAIDLDLLFSQYPRGIRVEAGTDLTVTETPEAIVVQPRQPTECVFYAEASTPLAFVCRPNVTFAACDSGGLLSDPAPRSCVLRWLPA